jgi:hypothetical protein
VNTLIYVAAIYASTSYLTRKSLWADLTRLQTTFIGPWMFVGDFNAQDFLVKTFFFGQMRINYLISIQSVCTLLGLMDVQVMVMLHCVWTVQFAIMRGYVTGVLYIVTLFRNIVRTITR